MAPPSAFRPNTDVALSNVDPVDGDVRNEVPIDRVAEGLVDAYAVLIDRHALRRTEHRRRLEATKQHFRLVGVRERVVEVDTTDLLVQCAEHAGGAVAGQVGCSQCLDVTGDLVLIDIEARDRSDADDDDFIEAARILGRLLCQGQGGGHRQCCSQYPRKKASRTLQV